jgi:PAS domain S-box-containing protein
MSNVGANNGSIIVIDENGEAIDGIIFVGDKVIEDATRQLAETLKDGLAGRVVRNKKGVLIADTSHDERWIKREDDKSGAKSAVSVPLIVREQQVGVMTLVHHSPGFFSPPHLELIQAIADQAGIAVLNARLYDDSQRRAHVMSALAESATEITASLNLDEVLQRILNQISIALRVEVVILALVDSQGDTLTFQASSSGPRDKIIGHQIKLGEGLAGQVALDGKGQIIPDAATDDHYAIDFDRISTLEVHAIACAPLIARGEIIGILEAFNPQGGRFDPDALEVLTGIGSLAGSAIDNARLFAQLQVTHQRYRELFQDSIDTILISEWNGSILEANRQAELFTGFDKDNLLSMTIDQLLAIDQERAEHSLKRLEPGETIITESELTTKNGDQLPVLVYSRLVTFEDGTKLQWLVRDMSERKKFDRLREDLISMIYHDLRSPLANVVSSLDVFSAMLPEEGDPSFRSLLNIALRSTERIQRLTNSLLDMSRLESGQPVVNVFSTSPVLLAVDAVDAVSPVAETKNQVINLKLPPDPPPITVDGDMIRRVLINLLENAVKYSPPGGEITLGIEIKTNFANIWVQDTGPGIPLAEQDHIFDKYARLNPEGSQKGFGLGLAYCRLAIEGHGGQIWVESEPGQGARFCLTLPILQGE